MHKSGALEQASPREPRKGEGRREVMKRGLEELLHWQSSKKPAACPGPCAVQCVESIKGKEKTSESEGKQIIQEGKTITLTADITSAKGPRRNLQSAEKINFLFYIQLNSISKVRAK